MNIRLVSLLAISVSLSSELVAQVPEGYTSVLLPILVDRQKGAYGSIWSSSVRIHNLGDEDAVLYFRGCYLSGGGCPTTFTVPPGRTIDPPLQKFDYSVGLTVFVPKAAKLAFGLRVADVTRLELDGGTEIPVVREVEMYTSTLALLNVPLAEGYRVALRIYDPDSHPGTFRVRAIDETGRITEFALITFILGEPPPGLVSEVPAIGTIHDLRSVLGPQILGPVTLLIEPVSATRFWAFATVTNNTSQTVSVISPY